MEKVEDVVGADRSVDLTEDEERAVLGDERRRWL